MASCSGTTTGTRGHYLPGYSILFPPLGAALGPRLVGALAAVAAAGLFGALARYRHGDRARLATLWFGAGTAAMLFSGRITFALGIAIGLGALLALQRDRPLLAAALAVLTALASPVAGLFLALAGVAVTLAGDRRGGAAVALPALAAVATLSLAFPTGGDEPFAFTAFIGVPLFALAALWLLPPEERTLRWGVAIYAIASIVAFAVANPVGGNMARLGALAAGPGPGAGARGPAAGGACGRSPCRCSTGNGWRPSATCPTPPETRPCTPLTTQPLLAQLERRTRGAPRASRDSAHPQPLGGRLRGAALPARPRLAAPARVRRRRPVHRREPDRRRRIGRGSTTAGSPTWPVPDAEPDYLSTDEEALIRGGLPYLRPVWSDQHWRLYRVEHSPGLVSRAGDSLEPGGRRDRLTALGPGELHAVDPRFGAVPGPDPLHALLDGDRR